MNEIIKIEKSVIGQEEVNSVNAREIHEYLQVKTRFDKWIQRAIAKYDFAENIDFVAIDQKRPTAQGNTTTYKDYIVSMDMAKELAMLENNKKGKEIRKYFISMEKKATSGALSGAGASAMMIQFMQNQQQLMIDQSKMIAEQNKALMEFMENQSKKTDTIIEKLTQPAQEQFLNPGDIDELKFFIFAKTDEAINKYNMKIDMATQYIYSQINKHFNIKSYYHLPKKDYEKALAFVKNIEFVV